VYARNCPHQASGSVYVIENGPNLKIGPKGVVQARLQFGVEKIGLGLDVLGQVFLGGTGIMRTR